LPDDLTAWPGQTGRPRGVSSMAEGRWNLAKSPSNAPASTFDRGLVEVEAPFFDLRSPFFDLRLPRIAIEAPFFALEGRFFALRARFFDLERRTD